VEVRVFNTILGIPAHPLLIHFAVVFIPLLAAGSIVYAAWPPFRSRITWAVLLLAVIAPLSALFAKLSGQNFKTRLIADKVVSPQILAKIVQHNSYGNKTFWWTVALGVLTLVFLAYTWQASRAPTGAAAGGSTDGSWTAMRIGSTVVMLVVGGIVGFYVFKTGDSGAHIVWGGF
jgi:uncharacterized membrane protein